MRITDIEAILLQGDETYRAAAGAEEAVDNGDWQLLVKVVTDEGLVGWSDVETLAPAAVAVIAGQGMGTIGFKTLREIAIGEDPLETDSLWEKLYVGSAYYGRRGIALHCISAIDDCCWSIKAQAAGVPLHDLLGTARRSRVTAYASTLFRETPEAMVAAASGYVEAGYRAVKFGWGVFGEDPARDVELVAAARETLGPDRDLLIDPGWYGQDWKGPMRSRTRDENLALCERLAPFQPGWVEDFIHPEHFDEYAWVREHSPVPLAAGEQLSTLWDFERAISEGCVDIIQPDLTRCGGLTVARRVAELADRAGIDLVPHSWLTDLLNAYSLHLIATLPRARFLEFNVSQSRLTQGVCGGTFELQEDGTVLVPDGVGLGVEVDTDFIEAHRVH